MWSAIVVPIFFAVVGWIVFNFFAKPLVDFLSLRSQVHEEIIFTRNIGPMVAGTADHLKAVESLRRLGAKVQAMDENVSISSLWLVFLPLRWFLSKQGYDLRRAGRGLIGLSNSLALTDGGRAYETKLIQVALKLPPPD
jgi:Na+-driven multidrug efflux pump